MTSKLMYFGTREHMTWVACPAINPDISKVGWSTQSQFLHGGASVRSSVTSHKVYQFSWSAVNAVQAGVIADFADGVYGSDLIYFLDPFALQTNLLPAYWAAPRLGIEDGPILSGTEVRPLEATTDANSFNYPTRSAVYTLDSTSVPMKLYIPLPTGYTLHIGAHGASTGSAAVTLADAASGVVSTTRVNYITNPSAEVGTTDWTAAGAGAVLTRQSSGGSAGAAFFRLTSGTATTAMSILNTGNVFVVNPGETVTFSARVKGTVGRLVGLRATWTGATASNSTTTAIASISGWQTISYSVTVPGAATAVRLDVTLAATGGLVGDILDVDSIMAERGVATPGTYFDGSMGTTVTGNTRTINSWQGTDHASPSQQVIQVSPGSPVPMLGVNTAQLTSMSINGVAGVEISMWGAGDLTLAGIVAQILPTGDPAPTGNFIGGRGHSGCRFGAQPAIQGYSAPQALDYQSMSATLIETGAWE